MQDDDVFKRLIPYWQLELYYQLAGACKNAPLLPFASSANTVHTDGVDYARWFGQAAEYARVNSSNGLSNGKLLINFVKYACDAVHEDLFDFFEKAGFLVPINERIEDYTAAQMTITQADINTLKAYITSKNYPKPVSPVINYISAHSVKAFLKKLPVSGQVGVGVSFINQSPANVLQVQTARWPNVVAFETYNTAGSLSNITIVGTGNVAATTTTIQYPATAGKVYAVGYDGKKILVYPVPLLPVEFVKVQVSNRSKSPIINQLNWQVGTEDNVAYYSIERSYDGSHFEWAGQTPAIHSALYHFYDTIPSYYGRGLSCYYRIKEIDKDGSYHFSSIVSTKIETDISALTVYPSPLQNELTIVWQQEGIKKFQLMDSQGRIVLERKTNNQKQVQLNTSALPKGNYFVVIIGADEVRKSIGVVK